MRVALCLVVLLVTRIASAQTPDALPAGDAPSPADVTPVAAESDDAAAPVAANTLYMCDFESDSPLYKLNPLNGHATMVGSMQLNQICTDLAFRKTVASGVQLFGTSFTTLFLINPTTGKAALLPSGYGSGITDINALVAQPGTGILYGAGSAAPGHFIAISPTTGKATIKGYLGTGISSAGDLEFLNGQLYGLVYKSGYGSATFLAKISLSAGTVGRATNLLPIRRNERGTLVTQNDVWGLANRGGVLYAVMRTGEVLTLNPTSGIAVFKGDSYQSQAGLAVSP